MGILTIVLDKNNKGNIIMTWGSHEEI